MNQGVRVSHMADQFGAYLHHPSQCSCLLTFLIVQVLLKKTTTVAWQMCDGSKTIGAPVLKTFSVRSGPILRVIMSLPQQPSGLDRVVSLTAAAMVIDPRRFESAYVQSARRQSSSNAQLDIVTSSANDARTLQAFADQRLAGILAGKGLQVLLITTRYVCACVSIYICMHIYAYVSTYMHVHTRFCESPSGMCARDNTYVYIKSCGTSRFRFVL